MKYAKESDYDSIIEKHAAAKFGGTFMPFLVKAICAVASEFHSKTVKAFPPRYGLMGVTLQMANSVSVTDQGFNREVSASELFEPEINIQLGACYIRTLYSSLNNPNMLNVVHEYAKHSGMSDWEAKEFTKKVWSEYFEFSQAPGQPDHYSPEEAARMAFK